MKFFRNPTLSDIRLKFLRTIFFFGPIFSVMSAAAQLPEESGELLEKLAEFEKAERAGAEARIVEKRLAVVHLLEKQMKERTKKGELDPAMAILAAVEALKNGGSVPEPMAEATQPEGGPEPDSRAPKDAVRHGGAHFRAVLTEDSVTWEEAREACRSVGGELAWFDSPDDERLIVDLLRGVNEKAGHVPVWVGGKKDRSGNWVWVNGEKVVPDFWANESDPVSKGADDVMIRWVGSFKPSNPDSERIGYICRWD